MSAPLWEGMSAEIQSRISDAAWLNRFLFHQFVPLAEEIVDLKLKGKKIPFWLRWLDELGNWIVLRPLRDNMGLKYIRHTYNSGALLGPDTIRFFHALRIPIKQLYGTTEIGLHCIHPDNDVDYETVGKVINPDCMKISPQGEILVRGPMIASLYLNDPEAWKKNFDDEGWFHTGDSGHINSNGHLLFYDRLKDMVTMPSGRKFSPQYVESRLKFSPYIKECIVMGGEIQGFRFRSS